MKVRFETPESTLIAPNFRVENLNFKEKIISSKFSIFFKSQKTSYLDNYKYSSSHI